MTRIGPCLGCHQVACYRPEELCPKCCAKWGSPWECWLPFPPTTNNLFSHGVVKGRVRRFPTPKYRAWRQEAVIRIRANWRTRPAWPVSVVLKLELVPPDRRPRDASNYVKPVEDALVEAGVLVDDSQNYVKAVVPWWAEPSAKIPGVIITIRPAREPQKPAPAQGELFAAT